MGNFPNSSPRRIEQGLAVGPGTVSHLNRGRICFRLGFVIVAIFGAVWGYLALGSTAMDRHNLKWLWGDLAQVYIAWGQYLSDPAAHWLSTTRLSHSLPISIALFDPMPLLLLLIRPLSGLVSGGQQFFGYYFVACLVLQGVFGYLAALRALALVRMKHYLLGPYIAVLAGIFFASIPYTSFRFQGHTALSSQWVLAMSIWVTLTTLEARRLQWMLANGCVILLATGLNPYLTLMTGVSTSLMAMIMWRKRGFKEVMLRVAFLVVVALAGFVVFGFMGGAGAESGGYGVYSMNMLGPLDSNGKAGLLRIDIPDATGGQAFEGFAYFGLGLLLLIGLALLSFVKHRAPDNDFPFVPAIIVVALVYILALSSTVTLSTYTWNLPVPDAMLSPLSRFRGSGRIFWIGGFWLILISISATVLRFGALRAATLLTVLMSLQVVDIYPLALNIRQSIATFLAKAELSGVETDGATSILVYPPWQCDHEGTPGGQRNYEVVGYFAMNRQIPTNNFYAARTPAEQSAYHCDYRARLAQLDPDAIYLLSPKLYSQYQATFDGRFRCSERHDDTEAQDPYWICEPARKK